MRLAACEDELAALKVEHDDLRRRAKLAQQREGGARYADQSKCSGRAALPPEEADAPGGGGGRLWPPPSSRAVLVLSRPGAPSSLWRERGPIGSLHRLQRLFTEASSRGGGGYGGGGGLGGWGGGGGDGGCGERRGGGGVSQGPYNARGGGGARL